jgi:hypothetical protein
MQPQVILVHVLHAVASLYAASEKGEHYVTPSLSTWLEYGVDRPRIDLHYKLQADQGPIRFRVKVVSYRLNLQL